METNTSDLMIVLQGYVPVRRNPAESAEMITQVLFGEYVEVLDIKGNWLRIKLLIDGYEGWADKKSFTSTSNKRDNLSYIAIQNTIIRDMSNGQDIYIPIGSAIPALRNKKFVLSEISFEVTNMDHFARPGTNKLQQVVKKVLSIPYLWGGRCGFGFDCSGLTQYLCRLNGKEIPRDSHVQAENGETLNFINESKIGDLAFFDNSEGVIHHVGMMLGNSQIIHASGLVRTDKIDQQGIYSQQYGKYTYTLRILKRM